VSITFDDPCGLYFTSGTTGQPKPILLTHLNMANACITENIHHSQTKKDIFILIPPLYHTGAKMHWLGSFVVGGAAVILKGISPESILEARARKGAPSSGFWSPGTGYPGQTGQRRAEAERLQAFPMAV